VWTAGLNVNWFLPQSGTAQVIYSKDSFDVLFMLRVALAGINSSVSA
jgi:hypothetical protein